MSNHGRFCECRECEREKHMGAAPLDPVGGIVGITGREYERLKKCVTEVDRLAAENEALKRELNDVLKRAYDVRVSLHNARLDCEALRAERDALRKQIADAPQEDEPK